MTFRSNYRPACRLVLIFLLGLILLAGVGCEGMSSPSPRMLSVERETEGASIPSPTPPPKQNAVEVETPESVTTSYFQALIQGDFQEAVSFLSDYSLALVGRKRRDIIVEFQRKEFAGWKLLDFKIMQKNRLDNETVLLDVVTKERNGDGEAQTFEFWLPLRREGKRWRLNWLLVIDARPLQVPPQEVNNVLVQPTRVVRYTDKIQLLLEVRNNGQRGCFWGWVGPRIATFHFGERQVDVPLQGSAPLNLSPQSAYPDVYVAASGLFDAYPTAVDLWDWRLASPTSPNLPDPSISPWGYHFSLIYQSFP